MEHLDLAGVITSSQTNWAMPAFDQQDAIYLSNSRQMLEPILEETSEDEEHAQNSWNQYENGTSFWSSAESETGSVIRIELNKDADSISERDFACPAKRARRSDEFQISAATMPTASLHQHQQQQQQQQLPQPTTAQPDSLDDAVLLRRYQRGIGNDYGEAHSSLERFLAYEASARDSYGLQRSSTGSRRFDEFYSDSDSLSYQSLSRSSSLIQFESLERQLLLQEQHASMTSLGNSSPSLLSFDGANSNSEEGVRSGVNSGSNSGNNSRRGSQSSLLKRFESADGRLHQTYFDLDKLDFDDEQRVLFGAAAATAISKCGNLLEATIGEVKSDSESTSSSSSTGSSSGHSILTASKPSAEDLTDSSAGALLSSRNCCTRLNAFQRGGKNSAENLSEDSGYCEPSTLRRTKSKSIPKNFEKFCEEEEEFQQYEQGDEDDELPIGDEEDEEADCGDMSRNTHSKNSNVIHYANAHDICQPKINAASGAFTLESSGDAAGTTATVAAFNEPTAAVTTTAAAGTPLPIENKPTTATTPAVLGASVMAGACPCYESVINSSAAATRERLLEHRRSLAHSPSPVSSDASGSSTNSSCRSSTASSASTCGSAASFTWLPIQMQRSPQLRQKQSRSGFSAALRNSLPDIRDALSSEAATEFSYRPQALHGYGLEQLKQATATTTTRGNDDSDISTTSSPNASAHNSRSQSDATDAEATPPETRKQITAWHGGRASGVGGGSVVVGGHSSRTRISSVPNELYKLGRKKRATKAKYSKAAARSYSSEEDLHAQQQGTDEADNAEGKEEEDDDYFAAACQKIRRSCSWSERRNERNLQKFEDAFRRTDSDSHSGGDDDDEDDEQRHLEAQALGYMNASYRDLTLLDYSGHEPGMSTQDTNQKRSSGNMAARRSNSSSADYERLICKGNFLLDELSQIYDKNASILNDKCIEHGELQLEEQAAEVAENGQMAAVKGQNGSPKPPPRQRKHSSTSNPSDADATDGAEDAAVQHVQLTIRKPPARQKHGRSAEATNSLVIETTTPALLGKTFDQDPTNLRTSYAQSLEKCNFDPKELSQCDLSKARSMPKRRFQTQAAKKRNIVSSTPNLNAYDHNTDEIEDDMYVSSAHTSMHQLPQGAVQKPLGILLPAGSRSSFGKEVSFCPVVSKYCWQEQSSEECNEPATPQEEGTAAAPATTNMVGSMSGRLPRRAEEESDDELLDNADATVIYNTRENEMIAARYKAEQQTQQSAVLVAQLREQPHLEQVRATTITKEHNSEVAPNEEQHSSDEEQQNNAEEHKTSHDLATTATMETVRRAPNRKLVFTESTTIISDDIFVLPPQAATTELGALQVSLKTTIVDEATSVEQAPLDATLSSAEITYHNNNSSDVSVSSIEHVPTTKRPLSIQLPILSEPPTNRAHHILYASQQMLDNFQRREREYSESAADGSELRARSVSNLSGSGAGVRSGNGMYHYTDTQPNGVAEGGIGATAKQVPNINNNNNQAMKSKFKDEKHPSSKGFLSRFANGFRFSLRRNKKKQLHQQKEQQQLFEQNQLGNGNGLSDNAKTTTILVPQRQSMGKAQTVDYIYIPLTGNLPVAGNSAAVTPNDSDANCTLDSNASTASAQSVFAKVGAKASKQQQKQHTVLAGKVTGKPPLPPTTYLAHAQYNQHLQNATANGGTSHPQQQQLQLEQLAHMEQPQQEQGEVAAEREPSPTEVNQFYTHNLLDAERSYYQLQTGMQANGCVAAAGSGGAGATDGQFAGMPYTSPSRASVSQKTQMFNNLSGATGDVSSVGGNGRVHVKPNGNNHSRIGLIETNLDTHETVITGKTRSLMDIGPQQSAASFKYGKRLNMTTGGGGAGDDGTMDEDEDDADVYVLEDICDEDGSSVIRKSVKQAGGTAGQIASVRRPHKSMEFLLDKENQKNVLVCIFLN